ncbi:MAG TPA: class I SAM-dependent methyltransferase, partial [Casimicrobiaceae bacterium]|nr:class I SAM-dependent methyltransferase [Casimicrobiaceae bacterium]
RKEIEQSGKDYYAHKTGFSPASLESTLRRAGFDPVHVFPAPAAFEVRALAFKTTPTPAQRQLLQLPA